MVERRLVVVVVLLFSYSVATAQQQTITIDVPHDLAQVPWRACVSGTASDESAQLVAVVHPTEVSSFWVQQVTSVRPQGKFEVPLYIGESAPGLHAGKTFEIRVVANPYQKGLKEGSILSGWPAAEGASRIIRVIRNDSVPSGCEKGAAAGGSNDLTPMLHGSDIGSRSRAPVGVAESVSPASSAFYCVVGVASLAFGLLFLALLIMVERIEPTTNWLAVRLDQFRAWLVGTALKMTSSICWLCNWLYENGRRRVKALWAVRGFSGDLRDFAVSNLLGSLLLIASVCAFYAEARTIVQALNPLFGVEEAQDNTGAGAIMDELVPVHEEVSVAPQQTNDDKRIARSLLDSIEKELTLLVGSVETLMEEKLGFLAIALAGLEGAFGVVLLWRLGTDRPIVLRPLALLCARPVVTICFVIMNITLGVLAAYRGYELSPSGLNWIMPTVVSAGIATVMPWILTFTLHYSFECAGDCVGVVSSAFLITFVCVGLCSVATLWGLLLLAILVSLAGAFACFFLFCIACCAVLLFAQVLGEAIRRIRREAWPSVQLPVPVQAASASLAVLFLLLGGYYIVRGLVQ